MAPKGATLSTITTVESHIHALGQCRRFIRQHNYKAVTAADTAGAARQISQTSDVTRGTLNDPNSPASVYVAVQDGAVCGFGSAGKTRWTGLATDGEISALYLLDAIKRRGVGRRLFRALIRRLAAQGFRSAGLWVLAAHAPARRFYEAMGGRSGERRTERRGELVLDEIAYHWDDLSGRARKRRRRT